MVPGFSLAVLVCLFKSRTLYQITKGWSVFLKMGRLCRGHLHGRGLPGNLPGVLRRCADIVHIGIIKDRDWIVGTSNPANLQT